MQIENLARQILVEADFAILAGLGIRADRLGVVEEVQRRRAPLDRLQLIGETPERVGTDGFALEGAGRGAADVALGDGHTEVIGPERDEPLEEADRRRTRLLEARLRVGAAIGPGPISAATFEADMPSVASRAAASASRSIFLRNS